MDAGTNLTRIHCGIVTLRRSLRTVVRASPQFQSWHDHPDIKDVQLFASRRSSRFRLYLSWVHAVPQWGSMGGTHIHVPWRYLANWICSLGPVWCEKPPTAHTHARLWALLPSGGSTIYDPKLLCHLHIFGCKRLSASHDTDIVYAARFWKRNRNGRAARR